VWAFAGVCVCLKASVIAVAITMCVCLRFTMMQPPYFLFKCCGRQVIGETEVDYATNLYYSIPVVLFMSEVAEVTQNKYMCFPEWYG